MTLYLASIVLIPIFFALFCIIGAVRLDTEHSAMKIALFLIALFSVISSVHFASLILYDIDSSFTEMQDLLGSFTYWSGRLIIVLVMYFLLYAFYNVAKNIQAQKKERMRY